MARNPQAQIHCADCYKKLYAGIADGRPDKPICFSEASINGRIVFWCKQCTLAVYQELDSVRRHARARIGMISS